MKCSRSSDQEQKGRGGAPVREKNGGGTLTRDKLRGNKISFNEPNCPSRHAWKIKRGEKKESRYTTTLRSQRLCEIGAHVDQGEGDGSFARGLRIKLGTKGKTQDLSPDGAVLRARPGSARRQKRGKILDLQKARSAKDSQTRNPELKKGQLHPGGRWGGGVKNLCYRLLLGDKGKKKDGGEFQGSTHAPCEGGKPQNGKAWANVLRKE